MIKKMTMTFIFLVLSTSACAGFKGPGATGKVVTVQAVGDMSDDSKVILEGHIINQIKEKHYTFKDDTGEIEIEIDDKDFRGSEVTPDIKVRIGGEVDKDWFSLKIEADYLEIVK